MRDRRISLGILVLAMLLPFFRLGLGELQPWDESLYVIRAVACLKFGCWLDQSGYAVGHLYSSVHPPFGVWLIAASRFLFGHSTSATRLPIALSASLCTLGVFAFLNHFVSRTASVVGAVSFATASLVALYSHRAQLEMPLIMLSVWSAWALLIAVKREVWQFALIGGLLLGLALLTKFAIAIFIVPLIVCIPWQQNNPRGYRLVRAYFAIALLLSVPWFFMMSMNHRDFLSHIFQSLDSLRSGSYIPPHLAWWYYLNQLLIAVPLLPLVLWRQGIATNAQSRLLLILTVWLILIFVALTLIGTKMPHFATLLVLPAAMLAGLGVDRMRSGTWKLRSNLLVIGLTAIFTIWASSEQLRLIVKGQIQQAMWPPIEIMLLVAVGPVILSGFLIRRVGGDWRLLIPMILICLALLHLADQRETVFENGAGPIASILDSLSSRDNLIILHSPQPHEQFAPQLAYYTGGWNLGWITGKTSAEWTWQDALHRYEPNSTRDVVVIQIFVDRFNHSSDAEKSTLDSLRKKLRESFIHERVFRSYILYF